VPLAGDADPLALLAEILRALRGAKKTGLKWVTQLKLSSKPAPNAGVKQRSRVARMGIANQVDFDAESTV
jgi:hypothetical protein